MEGYGFHYPPPRYRLNTSTALLLEGWIWHYITQEGWYAIKERDRNWNWWQPSKNCLVFYSLKTWSLFVSGNKLIFAKYICAHFLIDRTSIVSSREMNDLFRWFFFLKNERSFIIRDMFLNTLKLTLVYYSQNTFFLTKIRDRSLYEIIII